MKTFARNASIALLNGYVLTFYSEFAFYGQTADPGAPDPGVAELFLLWSIYALMAFIVLALIRRYHVSDIPALLIVGAAYGWMLEGGVVATAYESLPLSLSFTALAWHMPIDLFFGWYLVQKWLREKGFAFNLRLAALSGLLWGFWAVWPAEVISLRPLRFAVFAFATVGLLMTAYWLNGRLGIASFRPRRGEMRLAGALFLGWYFASTAFSVPISLLLLPALLLLCLWALRRNAARAPSAAPDLLDRLGAPPRSRNILAWAAFPLTAALEYAVWAAAPWRVPSNIIGYLVTVPLGFGLFGWALWRIGGAAPLRA